MESRGIPGFLKGYHEGDADLPLNLASSRFKLPEKSSVLSTFPGAVTASLEPICPVPWGVSNPAVESLIQAC